MSFARLVSSSSSSSLSHGLSEVYKGIPQNYPRAYVSIVHKNRQELFSNDSVNVLTSIAVGALNPPKEESKEEKLKGEAHFLQEFLAGAIEGLEETEKNEADQNRYQIIISYLSELRKAIAVAKDTLSASL